MHFLLVIAGVPFIMKQFPLFAAREGIMCFVLPTVNPVCMVILVNSFLYIPSPEGQIVSTMNRIECTIYRPESLRNQNVLWYFGL